MQVLGESSKEYEGTEIINIISNCWNLPQISALARLLSPIDAMVVVIWCVRNASRPHEKLLLKKGSFVKSLIYCGRMSLSSAQFIYLSGCICSFKKCLYASTLLKLFMHKEKYKWENVLVKKKIEFSVTTRRIQW